MELDKPLFSIILPTFNRVGFLPAAIESVLSQAYTNWELIIVDDGSTDSTKELVLNYSNADKRIKYIYQKNQERSAARNNGIRNASGDYICFLDSDDEYHELHLSALNKAIHDIEVVKPTIFYIDLYEDQAGSLDKPLDFYFLKEKRRDLLLFPIGCLRTVIPTDLFQFELFDVSKNIAEDTDLWLRMASIADFCHVKFPTLKVGIHQGRSVSLDKTEPWVKYRAFINEQLAKYSFMEIDLSTRFNLRSRVNFTFARHHYIHKRGLIAMYYILCSSLFSPISNFKTKAFMLREIIYNRYLPL